VSSFAGPYSRQIYELDRIADAITHSDVLDPATSSRSNDALQRLADYFEENDGIPGAKKVNADWNATTGPSVILNKPDLQSLIDAYEEESGLTLEDLLGASTASDDDIDSLFA